jgi:hypothetical protein
MDLLRSLHDITYPLEEVIENPDLLAWVGRCAKAKNYVPAFLLLTAKQLFLAAASNKPIQAKKSWKLQPQSQRAIIAGTGSYKSCCSDYAVVQFSKFQNVFGLAWLSTKANTTGVRK